MCRRWRAEDAVVRSKWRDVVWRGLRLLGAGPLLLRVHPSSGLRRAGWFRSSRHRDSIDRSGVALPWWGYAAIQFIEERIRRDARALEFGSGNSTCWLAERVASIVTIENDPQ